MHKTLRALSLLVLASTLSAQDDVSFAEALMRRGWEDLAEIVCLQTERGSGPEELRARAGFMYYQILKARAQKTGSEDDFEAAEDYLKGIQRKYKNTLGATTGLDLLLGQVSRAETYMGSARDAESEEEAAEALAKSREIFEEVLAEFEKLTEKYSSELEDVSERDILRDSGLTKKANDRDLAEFLELKALKSYSDVLTGVDDDLRREVLKQALEKGDVYYLDRYSPINVSRWCWATIIYGQLNLSMAELSEGSAQSTYFDAALEYFEEMSLFRIRQMPEDEEIQKSIKAFVKEVSLEAFYYLVSACNFGSRVLGDSRYLDRALVFADKALGGPNAGPRGPRWEGEVESFWARRLLLEKAVTLTSAGRSLEGLEILIQEVERSERSRERRDEWLGLDKFGVAACQKMSEIWESTDLELPSRCAILSGKGFLFRGDQEMAAKAFASGVSNVRGERDRDEAAEGLFEAGMCYVRMEQELKAALIFEQIFRLFPNAPIAPKAATYAADFLLKSQKKMKVASNALKDLIDAANRKASEGGGGNATKIAFNSASNSEKKGDFSRAAVGYAGIPPTFYDEEAGKEVEVEFYGKAQAKAGDCYYKVFLKDGRSDDIESALACLDLARVWAEEKADIETLALCAFLTARVQLDPSQGDPEQAVSTVDETFDVINGQWQWRALARQLQVEALCRLGRPDDAAKKLAEIEEALSHTADAQGAYKNAVLSLLRHHEQIAQAYNISTQAAAAEVGKLRKTQKAMADRPGAVAGLEQAIAHVQRIQKETYERHLDAALNAAGYATVWAEQSEDLDLGVRIWLASVLFIGHEYEAGIGVYERLLSESEAMTPQQRASLPASKLNLAVCYAETGRLQEAAEMLDQLNEEQPKEYGVLAERARVKMLLYEEQRAKGRPDPNLLLGENGVKSAFDDFYLLLDELGQENYDKVVESFPAEVKDYSIKKYQTIYQMYLIKYYNKDWAQVVSDITFHEKWNEFDVLPRSLVDQFMQLKEDCKREGKL